MKYTFLLLILLTSLTACSKGASSKSAVSDTVSTSIKGTIGVPNVPPLEKPSKPLKLAFKPLVYIGKIQDIREKPTLLVLNGQEINPRGDVKLFAQYALRQVFRNHGFGIAEDAPIVIEGTIKKWICHYQSGALICEAVLRVNALDPVGQSIFENAYDGFFQTPTSSIDETKAKEALAEAMHEALRQLVNDQQLVSVITSF